MTKLEDVLLPLTDRDDEVARLVVGELTPKPASLDAPPSIEDVARMRSASQRERELVWALADWARAIRVLNWVSRGVVRAMREDGCVMDPDEDSLEGKAESMWEDLGVSVRLSVIEAYGSKSGWIDRFVESDGDLGFGVDVGGDDEKSEDSTDGVVEEASEAQVWSADSGDTWSEGDNAGRGIAQTDQRSATRRQDEPDHRDGRHGGHPRAVSIGDPEGPSSGGLGVRGSAANGGQAGIKTARPVHQIVGRHRKRDGTRKA